MNIIQENEGNLCEKIEYYWMKIIKLYASTDITILKDPNTPTKALENYLVPPESMFLTPLKADLIANHPNCTEEIREKVLLKKEEMSFNKEKKTVNEEEHREQMIIGWLKERIRYAARTKYSKYLFDFPSQKVTKEKYFKIIDIIDQYVNVNNPKISNILNNLMGSYEKHRKIWNRYINERYNKGMTFTETTNLSSRARHDFSFLMTKYAMKILSEIIAIENSKNKPK